MAPNDEWYEEQAGGSAVKADIVAAYFDAWGKVMASRNERIAYIDLYAGPGRYESGNDSTPLRVLQKVIEHTALRARTLTFFNDANEEFAQRLKAAIADLPNIESLAHTPDVDIGEVDDHYAELFEGMNTIPVLGFLDPWGYKGLSLRLIQGMIKDFGCEAIFFFNYNRINMAITNPVVTKHMEALFGTERLALLREKVVELNPVERERLITEEMAGGLRDAGAKHLLAFRFRRSNGRLSHILYHVSKHELAYSIMKSVMAKRGIVDDDGVPRFEYIPAGAGAQLMLGEERPIVELERALLTDFAGQTVTVGELCQSHNIGRQFIQSNYKAVIRKLRDEGRIVCARDKPVRVGQMPDDVVVTFPS